MTAAEMPLTKLSPGETLGELRPAAGGGRRDAPGKGGHRPATLRDAREVMEIGGPEGALRLPVHSISGLTGGGRLPV